MPSCSPMKFPLEIVDAAAMKFRLVEMRSEEGLVVVARDEADFLAIDFVGDSQAQRARDLADGRLRPSPPRGVRAWRNCCWRKRGQEIGLVLAWIDPFAQDRAIPVMFDDGVMAGGDESRSRAPSPCPRGCRISPSRCTSRTGSASVSLVFAGKIIDDEALELIGFIHDVMRNAQRVRDIAARRPRPADRSICPRRARCSPAARPSWSRRRRRIPAGGEDNPPRWNRRHRSCRAGRVFAGAHFARNVMAVRRRVNGGRTGTLTNGLPASVNRQGNSFDRLIPMRGSVTTRTFSSLRGSRQCRDPAQMLSS